MQHLPRSQRFALAGVFLLGAAVTSASGIRMHYHLKLVESGEGNFDFTRELFLPHSGPSRQRARADVPPSVLTLTD